MAVAKRILLMILAVAGVALAIAVSGPASAAPIPAYTTGAAIAVSNVNPAGCSTIMVSGTGFKRNEQVALTLHSTVYSLKRVNADANGAFSTTVTLVPVSGNSHFIQAKGLTSGKLATANITIQHPQCRGVDAAATHAANGGGSNGVGGASTSSNGGGGLSSTGVAVIGLGVIALGLIVAGSIFTFSGRGRRAVA